MRWLFSRIIILTPTMMHGNAKSEQSISFEQNETSAILEQKYNKIAKLLIIREMKC